MSKIELTKRKARSRMSEETEPVKKQNKKGGNGQQKKRPPGFTTCRLQQPISIAANPRVLKFELTAEDARLFRQCLEKDTVIGRKRRWMTHGFAALSAIIASGIISLATGAMIEALIVATAFWAFIAYGTKWLLRFVDWYEEQYTYKLPTLRAPGVYQVTFGKDTMAVEAAAGDFTIPLSRIRTIEISDHHLLLFRTETAAFLIPKRTFPSEAEWKSILQFLTVLMEEVRSFRESSAA